MAVGKNTTWNKWKVDAISNEAVWNWGRGEGCLKILGRKSKVKNGGRGRISICRELNTLLVL